MTAGDKVKSAAERYSLPHDSAEVTRLRSQHEWFKSNIGQLVLAPLDKTRPNMKILDSGTADGYWLLDLSASLPSSSTYIGTDVAPQLFPSDYGDAFTFECQSITEPWPLEWSDSFDLVHQRLVLPVVSPEVAREAVHNLVNMVKPGGFIQLVEPDISAIGKGIVNETPAQHKYAEMNNQVFSITGGNIKPGPHLREWLEACNLEGIEDCQLDLGTGVRSKDTVMAESSIENMLRMVSNFKRAAQGERHGGGTCSVRPSGREGN
ncbi:MAG: hypothetical protein M1813_008624 [Trichoglossum hirsutum]|nr:MAG: hypothetical protein M1813_008624 [Trichoglossum hirsutum]